VSLVERVGEFLAEKTSRRSFIARTTLTATALSVGPLDLLLRPVSAYAVICQCANLTCSCDQLCCDGYTQFCCTINNGVNACPLGTFPGGWWKADGSIYCAGPRYYIDCMGDCLSCGCGGGSFCPGCEGLACQCALGTCDNRHIGCAEFRYGQCHQEIACSGRIACRVVSCTPPWLLDPSCTTVSQTDDSTANHFAPCQNGVPPPPPPPPIGVMGMAVTRTGQGYWLVDDIGRVTVFGDATNYGDMSGKPLNQPVMDIAATPTGAGYWLVSSDGGIFTFGDAPFFGSAGDIRLNQPMVGVATDRATGGYWTTASDGGVFSYDAPFEGSTGNIRLNRPVVGMAATPSGNGYWLVASDGGIFTFGDAGFFGSTGNIRLNKPVVGMAATPSGNGYWLVASDGGIFTFGDAGFFGSTGNIRLNQPVTGMAATPTGRGYWLVAFDGGIFTFGDAGFFGAKPGA
jgi:hypothetical protein